MPFAGVMAVVVVTPPAVAVTVEADDGIVYANEYFPLTSVLSETSACPGMLTVMGAPEIATFAASSSVYWIVAEAPAETLAPAVPVRVSPCTLTATLLVSVPEVMETVMARSE